MFKNIIILLVVFIVGGACGYFALPAKIVEKQVVKTIIEKDYSANKNKVIIITVTKKPDGTEIKTTKIVDKSVINIDTKKDITDTKSKETIYSKNSVILTLSGGPQLGNISNGFIYGAQVQKRMFGPLYMGISAQSNKVISLLMSLSF